MAKVFISFIHEEQDIAEAVQSLLREDLDTREIFLSSDQWQVFAGEIWLDRIRTELSAAKVVVLLLSQESVGRPWVNFEAGAAWLSGKAIIPVCYGGLAKSNLPKPYSGIQALDLREESYYLVSSVAHYIGVLPPPPGPLEPPESCRRLWKALDKLEGNRVQ